MRKSIIAFSLSGFLVLGLQALRAENQFENFTLQQTGQLIANPPMFFYEFQRNMESTFPLPPGRWIGAHYHMLGGILAVPLPDVTTAGNVSFKLRIHPEGRLSPGLPQLDLVGGYWNSYLTSLLEEDAGPDDKDTKVTNVDLKGRYMGLVLASSLEPQVRLFWSYKHSVLDMNLELSKEETIFGTPVKSYSGGLKENTLSSGIEYMSSVNHRWYLEGGYGLINKTLTAKVAWSGRFMDFGVNIYPESVFIMQPQLNFHVQF